MSTTKWRRLFATCLCFDLPNEKGLRRSDGRQVPQPDLHSNRGFRMF